MGGQCCHVKNEECMRVKHASLRGFDSVLHLGSVE